MITFTLTIVILGLCNTASSQMLGPAAAGARPGPGLRLANEFITGDDNKLDEKKPRFVPIGAAAPAPGAAPPAAPAAPLAAPAAPAPAAPAPVVPPAPAPMPVQPPPPTAPPPPPTLPPTTPPPAFLPPVYQPQPVFPNFMNAPQPMNSPMNAFALLQAMMPPPCPQENCLPKRECDLNKPAGDCMGEDIVCCM